MAIESRMIVGGAAAFALVGAVLWGSTVLLTSPPPAAQVSRGTVEISSVDEKAWMVEVQDAGPVTQQNRTAANR
jgi:hypothetical protein